MSFEPPQFCPWRCYLIGGPWISSDPSCPFHGTDKLPTNDDGSFDISEEEGKQMCKDKEAANLKEYCSEDYSGD